MGAVPWILAMLFLAGCTTVGPDFVPPTAPLLDQWQEADSAVVTRDPAEQTRWWEAFGDPVLDRLIALAYQNYPDLKITGMRVLDLCTRNLGAAFAPLFAVGGVNERAIVMVALGVPLQTIAAIVAARVFASRAEGAGASGQARA